MKYCLFLLVVFTPIVAAAHDDAPVCRCSLVERDPLWIVEHDAWHTCDVAFRAQQAEYARCLGAVAERVSLLSKKARRKYVPYFENPGILGYKRPQHPTEDKINDVEGSHAEVVACETQLGSQIIPEVLACSAHLQYLRGLR